MNGLLDDEDELHESWRIIANALPEFGSDPMPAVVEVRRVLEMPIHRTLALWFLQDRQTRQSFTLLNTDQLVNIASKVRDSESDIEQLPGVYIFCSIADGSVLKVGQSQEMRQRIACEHLRKETMNTNSLLIDHAKRRWNIANDVEWHQSLRDHEVTAMIFPMRKSEEWDRLVIEYSLIGTLHPVMP